jgi:hypothetical protein
MQVILITNHTNSGLASVEISYKAHVLHGGLGYHRPSLTFHVPAPVPEGAPLKLEEARGREQVTREVQLSNLFPIRLALEDVRVRGCENSLEVVGFQRDGAGQHETWPNVSLRFFPQVALQYYLLPHVCSLAVATNASHHVIPVYISNGRLHPSLGPGPGLAPERSICFIGPRGREDPLVIGGSEGGVRHLILDLGLTGLNQTRTASVALTNFNPLPIRISGPETNLTRFVYTYAGQAPSPLAPDPVLASFRQYEKGGEGLALSPPTRDKELVEGLGVERRWGGRGGRPAERRKKRKKKSKRKRRGRTLQRTLPRLLSRQEALSIGATGVEPTAPAPPRLRFRVAYAPRARSSCRMVAPSRPSPVSGRPLPVEREAEEGKGQDGHEKSLSVPAMEVVEVVSARGRRVWTVDAGHSASFNISAQTPEEIPSELVNLEMRGLELRTEAETFAVTVRMAVTRGEVTFDVPDLKMGSWFPGKTMVTDVFMSNSMAGDVELRSISVSKPWFVPHLLLKTLPAKASRVRVATIAFDPSCCCEGLWPCLREVG